MSDTAMRRLSSISPRTGYSWKQVWRYARQRPWFSAMTVVSLGFSLFPAALALFWAGLGAELLGDATRSPTLNAYLNVPTDEAQSKAVQQRIRDWPQIDDVVLISAAQARQDMRQYAHWQSVLDTLPDNPLPATLIINPTASAADNPATLRALLTRLNSLPELAEVQADLQWSETWRQVRATVLRGLALLSGILGAGACLALATAIRQEAGNRAREIEIMRLLGSDEALIREPVLVGAAVTGLTAAVVALMLASLVSRWTIDQIEVMPWINEYGWKWVWPDPISITLYLLAVVIGCVLIARLSLRSLPFGARHHG